MKTQLPTLHTWLSHLATCNNNNNNNLYLYSAVSTKKPTALNKATYYKQINITLLI